MLPLVVDEDVTVRRDAWEVLSHTAGKAALPAALRALEDADRVVRVNAVCALGRIGAAEPLIRVLASEDPWLRRVAAKGLGVAKAAEGVAPLAKTLEDPDWIVVQHAIEALGAIGPAAAAAVPALERLRDKPDGLDWSDAIEPALKKIRG